MMAYLRTAPHPAAHRKHRTRRGQRRHIAFGGGRHRQRPSYDGSEWTGNGDALRHSARIARERERVHRMGEPQAEGLDVSRVTREDPWAWGVPRFLVDGLLDRWVGCRRSR